MKEQNKMYFVRAAWRTINLSRGKNERDTELRQLTKSIKKTMRVQKREVMGLGDIVFTVGSTQTETFAQKNEILRERGESYYVRVKNDIGSKELVVFLWIKLVAEKDEFITDIKLGSTRTNHNHFFFGEKEGYQIIVHPELQWGAAAPSLCLWYKKESNKSRHVCDLKVSYTKEDQIDLIRKNYEKLPLCLSKFGCAYANIWILWASKDAVRLTDSAHIEKELQDYSAMLKASPDDPILIKMVETANQRLRQAQLMEEDHAKDIPYDDLVYTKQFLGLKPHELDELKSIFQRSIDFDRDGKISVEDYAMFLGEPLSMISFVGQIFALSSNGSNNVCKYSNSTTTPMMDVGSTLKATAVFCMLSSTELLKFIFASYDQKGYGHIDNGDFKQLLASFHPRHSDEHVIRALKECDLPKDRTMSFETFATFAYKFPRLLYPAFRVQENMRKKFLGVQFWRRKMIRYEEAKKLLSREEEKSREAERLERQERDDFANDLNIDTIDIFVEKRMKKSK